MLVDSKGMTLYTYDKDSDGKSACNGQCAENWPPLMAEAGAKAEGEWSVVKRDDGSMQWAYGGKPVYTFVMDKKAGDVTGDGKMGVWHIVKP
ncbi:Secreted repeat [compost metagenome]